MNANAVIVALAALCATCPPAARADDTLAVVGGSNAAAFFEVIDHVAQQGGFFKDEHLIVTKEYTGVASTCAQLVASGKGDICSLASSRSCKDTARVCACSSFSIAIRATIT